MKKFNILCVVLAFVFVLSGCSNTNEELEALRNDVEDLKEQIAVLQSENKIVVTAKSEDSDQSDDPSDESDKVPPGGVSKLDYAVGQNKENTIFFGKTKWGMTKEETIAAMGKSTSDEGLLEGFIKFENYNYLGFSCTVTCWFNEEKLYKINCHIDAKNNLVLLEGEEPENYELKLNNLIAGKLTSIIGEPDKSDKLADSANPDMIKMELTWEYEYVTCILHELTKIEFEYTNETMYLNGKAEPKIGMTEEGVLNSTWGEPAKIRDVATSTGKNKMWIYPNNKSIYFVDGVVSVIR